MNEQQKAELVEATQRHAELDMLVQGRYGDEVSSIEKFKGCSVGCLAAELGAFDCNDEYIHEIVADHYGYPEWLVRLQDEIFENASKDIHVRLAKAMKPREDWQSVMHAIHYRMLVEVVLPNAGESSDIVRQVATLHKNQEPTDSAAWSEAESAARSEVRPAEDSSAMLAAWLAARSAVESAVESTAESALWSTRSAPREECNAAWQGIMNIVLEEVAK